MVSPYLDGASLADMKRLSGRWEGLTTNPSLMKKAGITDYREFAHAVLEVSGGLPVSFEVLASSVEETIRQAVEMSRWAPNVYVKIPVIFPEFPDGSFVGEVIHVLSGSGVKLNVTAVMTLAQVETALFSLIGRGHVISIFAGRIADAGVDPEPIVREAVAMTRGSQSILWASAREVFNVKQAARCGADIITLAPDLFEKMEGFGRDLTERSLETVRQFQRDAEGITL